MNTVPLWAEQLTEGVTGGKTHPHPIRAELLDRRDAKVLRLADSHRVAKLTGVGWWGQAGGSPRGACQPVPGASLRGLRPGGTDAAFELAP
jgi:hypothetical protein